MSDERELAREMLGGEWERKKKNSISYWGWLEYELVDARLRIEELERTKAGEFWKYVEDNYKEVSSWPAWMRGGKVAACPDPSAHQADDVSISALRKRVGLPPEDGKSNCPRCGGEACLCGGRKP